MSKYEYLNLNQKMVKIRKKIPALIRKRYSEDVDYDFVKLDDINQFLAPALNRYGVDFDILGETPTQTDDSGRLVFLIHDGNFWRYEADLEICWTNADRPQEQSRAVVHLIGTHEVADKAKGTAMTYGLKYYLLNKFNIPQNGAEDPDMRGTKPEKEGQTESAKKTETAKTGKKPKAEKADSYVPSGKQEEGAVREKTPTQKKEADKKPVRNGNAVSSRPEPEETKEKETKPQRMEEKTAGADQISFFERAKDAAQGKEEKAEPESAKAAEASEVERAEEKAEEKAEAQSSGESGQKAVTEVGDGFQAVTETEEIPFDELDDGAFDFSDNRSASGAETAEDKEAGETGNEEDPAEEEQAEVENAKAVICNFGFFKGHTLGELLESAKGWETIKWMAERYNGANHEMKDAAKVLVEAKAYMPKAA